MWSVKRRILPFHWQLLYQHINMHPFLRASWFLWLRLLRINRFLGHNRSGGRNYRLFYHTFRIKFHGLVVELQDICILLYFILSHWWIRSGSSFLYQWRLCSFHYQRRFRLINRWFYLTLFFWATQSVRLLLNFIRFQ